MSFKEVDPNSDYWRVYFEFEDFRQAREMYPGIFEWIDQPEKYISEFMHQINDRNKPKIPLEDLDEYHRQVMEMMDDFVGTLKDLVPDQQRNSSLKKDTKNIQNEVGRALAMTKKISCIRPKLNAIN